MRITLAALLCLILVGCGGESRKTDATAEAQPTQTYNWKLVTTWPKNFPGLGLAPEHFAENVQRMSNGRLKIKVFGAGQLVPAFEVFDAVSQGTAEMGHGAAYYWQGKIPASAFLLQSPLASMLRK